MLLLDCYYFLGDHILYTYTSFSKVTLTNQMLVHIFKKKLVYAIAFVIWTLLLVAMIIFSIAIAVTIGCKTHFMTSSK